MKRALSHVTQRTDYLHVSFDLDVVELIADSREMTSCEMVEMNPLLDTQNVPAEFAVELVQSVFGKRIL
jgi:arginase family enzyme